MFRLWQWVFPMVIYSMAMYSCSTNAVERLKSKVAAQNSLVLLAYHPKDSTSLDLNHHLSQTLKYAGIPYGKFSLSGESKLPIPNSARLIYVTTDIVEQLSQQQVNQLVKYTAAGNTIIFLMPVYDERFSYLLGIKPEATYRPNPVAKGFYFKRDIFPHFSGYRYKSDSLLHYGFAKSQFASIDQVIATAANDTTYPVIIEQNIGAGHTIYFNTLTTNRKEFRGLAFSVALKALEGIPYRVANVSTIFLDDFPAPLYDKKLPPIKQEYGITHAEFVYEVWWPDMKQLADSFNINYTALLAFNYNAAVRPPFDFNEWEASMIHSADGSFNGSIRLARDIRDSRHELGFHGYNHFSLWVEDWMNANFMRASLDAAKKRWVIDQLGPFPVTYVPPTNLIDSVGLSTIVKAMPGIKYMCSLYHGHIDDGGGREFGPDPFAPELFNYPRVTSGSTNSERSAFLQNSLFLYTGIWTHFIHPDDVFQIKSSNSEFKSRNARGLGWQSSEEYDFGLFDLLKRRLKETQRRYPVSRYLSVRQAVPIVKRWLKQKSHYSFEETQLVVTTGNVHQDKKGEFWFMYVGQPKVARLSYALKEQDIDVKSSGLWSGQLMQFSVNTDTFRIPRFNSSIDNKEQIVARTMHNYQQYLPEEEPTVWKDLRFEKALARYAINPLSKQVQNDVIKLGVEFDSLEIAVSVLENRLMHSTSWPFLDMVQLLTYYSWNQQVERAVKFAEKMWTRYEGEPAFAYVNLLNHFYGIAEREFKERWLKRELKLYPHNTKLLQQLITLYNTAEAWPKKKRYIKTLIALEEQSDTLYAYALGESIAYDSPKNTLSWLEKFPDEAYRQLHPLVDDIAYIYANQKKYTRAIIWAKKTDKIPYTTRFYWLLQQERYYSFIQQGKALIKEKPSDANLRIYLGQQLLYANFRDEGYDILYPLFKKEKASDHAEELVHNEIGWMDYDHKQELYQQYPAFFSSTLKEDLQYSYRMTEGISQASIGSYSFDNFGNRVRSLGLRTEWGNRRHQTHQIQIEEITVNSGFKEGYPSTNLFGLKYRYKQNYRNQTMHTILGGGVYLSNEGVQLFLESQFGIAQKTSYTSAQLSYQPVLRNVALEQNIGKLQANLYRKDYWLADKFRSALSAEAKSFSDNNFSYNISLRGYWNLPLMNSNYQISPFIAFSREDALKSYTNGFPYYTPNKLNIMGAGINLKYQGLTYSDAKVNLNLMSKYSNRDGLFFVSSIVFKKQIWRYWNFLVRGYFSTSKTYRYNNFDVAISYTFPKRF